jgi:hypothetical protein
MYVLPFTIYHLCMYVCMYYQGVSQLGRNAWFSTLIGTNLSWSSSAAAVEV